MGYQLLLKCVCIFEGASINHPLFGLGLKQLIHKTKFQQEEDKISPFWKNQWKNKLMSIGKSNAETPNRHMYLQSNTGSQQISPSRSSMSSQRSREELPPPRIRKEEGAGLLIQFLLPNSQITCFSSWKWVGAVEVGIEEFVVRGWRETGSVIL